MVEENWMEFFGWQEKQLNDLRFVAYSYLKQGKYDIAASFFNALIIFNPKNAYDWSALGSIKLEQNKPKEALECLEEALKLNPFDYVALLNQAKAYFSLGKSDQAYEAAENLKDCPDKKIAQEAESLYKMLERVS